MRPVVLVLPRGRRGDRRRGPAPARRLAGAARVAGPAAAAPRLPLRHRRRADRARARARRTAVLTFDDGWRDGLTVVAPLLERLGGARLLLRLPGAVGRRSTALVTGPAGAPARPGRGPRARDARDGGRVARALPPATCAGSPTPSSTPSCATRGRRSRRSPGARAARSPIRSGSSTRGWRSACARRATSSRSRGGRGATGIRWRSAACPAHRATAPAGSRSKLAGSGARHEGSSTPPTGSVGGARAPRLAHSSGGPRTSPPRVRLAPRPARARCRKPASGPARTRVRRLADPARSAASRARSPRCRGSGADDRRALGQPACAVAAPACRPWRPSRWWPGQGRPVVGPRAGRPPRRRHGRRDRGQRGRRRASARCAPRDARGETVRGAGDARPAARGAARTARPPRRCSSAARLVGHEPANRHDRRRRPGRR